MAYKGDWLFGEQDDFKAGFVEGFWCIHGPDGFHVHTTKDNAIEHIKAYWAENVSVQAWDLITGQSVINQH